MEKEYFPPLRVVRTVDTSPVSYRENYRTPMSVRRTEEYRHEVVVTPPLELPPSIGPGSGRTSPVRSRESSPVRTARSSIGRYEQLGERMHTPISDRRIITPVRSVATGTGPSPLFVKQRETEEQMLERERMDEMYRRRGMGRTPYASPSRGTVPVITRSPQRSSVRDDAVMENRSARSLSRSMSGSGSSASSRSRSSSRERESSPRDLDYTPTRSVRGGMPAPITRSHPRTEVYSQVIL